MADLNKVEIAVAGLRKIYLPREWEPRCSTCGVRHAPLEGGTCKFWVQFALNAGERALRLAAGGDVEAPQQQPTPSPGTLAAVAAATPLPSELRDALDALDGDAALRAGLGDAFVDSYLKLRRAHWADYAATLSPFEFDHYLDC